MNLIVSSPFEVIVIRIQSIRKPNCHADFARYDSSWPPPFFCCSLVSHSNKTVKKPLTFSTIARASSSDSRWALRGCQTSSVRSIRLSSDFFIKTSWGEDLSLKNQSAEIDVRAFNLKLGGFCRCWLRVG